jgi:Asp-tRNA(Asn)/Glu-tRNA(Gln) amidotransferase A subunit family amidase
MDGMQKTASSLLTGWRQVSPESAPVVAVPVGPYLDRASEEARRHLDELCDRLTAAAFEVLQVPALSDLDAVVGRHNLLLAGEAAAAHSKWFAEYCDLYDPRTANLILEGQRISQPELEEARVGRKQLRQELEVLMDEYGFDLWASPAATGLAPLGLESTGDPAMNLPWTYAGLPTVALPSVSSASGLPLGLQLAARWNRDEELLAWGVRIEEGINR